MSHLSQTTREQPNAAPKTLTFISLRDAKGRTSSLSHSGRTNTLGYLSVIGNLEHNADIRPATEADRRALIAWLQANPIRS